MVSDSDSPTPASEFDLVLQKLTRYPRSICSDRYATAIPMMTMKKP